MMDEDKTVYFSRFAFIFLIYVVLSSGYISDVLSCQMQKFLTTNNLGRHVLGFIMIFIFIMLEGGWSFDKEEGEASENNWSSGNVLDSSLMAFAIYVVFIISSKSQLMPNLVFFVLLFILYGINTQRSYWLARDKISTETNDAIINGEILIFGGTICTLLYGFVDYVLYQKRNLGNKFLWSTFLMGKTTCASMV